MSTVKITLTGPPGSGKTLIAHRIANALLSYNVKIFEEGAQSPTLEYGNPNSENKILIYTKQEG